jgi:uncharacterized protein (DUF427 family)
MQRPTPHPAAPGQESVWNYPRPPRLERVGRRVRIVFNGVAIADTGDAKRVLETSHPPTYYIPPEDVRHEYLEPAPGQSFCEWKGMARYFTVAVNGRRAERVAWAYPDPTPGFRDLTGHFAFYAGPMDACYVGDEKARPQPGGFYGGWITGDVVGPFKGEPGSQGW